MGTPESHIFELAKVLAKSFRENLSESEGRILNNWLDASEKNKELYARMKDESWFEEKMRQTLSVDWKQDYIQFVHDHQNVISTKRRYRFVFQYAAVAILLISVGLGAALRYWGKAPEVLESVPIVAQNDSVEKGKAVLTLVDGEKIVLNDTGAVARKEQTGALLNISGTELSYRQTSEEVVKEDAYNQLSVSRGGEYYLILSDGTKVWLNSESSLRYPVSFRGKQRKVYLTGEAFFTVTHDKEKPFIVVAGGTETEVLGTEFNVRAYPEETSISTTLVKGCVQMRVGEGLPNVVLSPGEQGRMLKEKRIVEKHSVDAYLYTAWKDGRLVFRRAKMGELLKVLSRWYDVEIVYRDQEVKDISFTGDLCKTDRIESLLNIIENNGLVEFSLTGKILTVNKK